jgi:hypothetical protein
MPNMDELDEALQENLKLRRKLRDQVAKAKHVGGMPYRLGWVLYWTCIALAVCRVPMPQAKCCDSS